MSDPQRVLLLGATGLVGRHVMERAVGREDVMLLALTRREIAMPEGARMEVLVAPREGWDEAIAVIAPDKIICALGTTIGKEGGDQEAFAAIDRDLVLRMAEAAKAADVQGFAVVSSVGANPRSENFYLRTKGEMEQRLLKTGIKRIDILRPGLLRGSRENDLRPLEGLARMASPLTNLFLTGDRRKYRAIHASDVASALLQASLEKAGGRFTHEYDAIQRLIAKLERD